jgi:kinesin family protein 15
LLVGKFGVQLLTKEKKVVELKELVAEQLGKWEAENETLMVAALEAEHQFLDKDQKLHLTQKSLVTLQAQMTEAEVHERALSSRIKDLLVGNEAAVRENDKLRLEVSELRVNAERLELELLRLGSVNAARLTALESKLQKAQESIEDAETRMKLMVSEMEATSLATEKLESKAESLISGSLLGLQKELAKVLEEKIESEQLATAEKSELLRDLNRLDSENLILKSDIQHLGVKLEHAKRLALEKELEMSAVKEDRHQIETKAKHVQENLETLIDAYTVSESKWEEEKEILTSENRKLASCMACRDMEFAALQEHKMILERSLHEVSENRGLLQQRLETLEAKWNAEKEKFPDCLAESSKLLSDKEKTMEAMQMELAEAHSSLCASSAKITLLLETNAVRHEEWVAERSQLQSLQEQLQSELTHSEQYAAELHKSCSHVLSPLSENRTIPASNGRSSSKLFDDMKKEVERTRINCEKLHAKLREKDNAILCVQMEFGAVKAKSMQVECDLKNLHQEKEKLRYELAVVNSKLAEAQDEICCRKLQLQAYESELGRVMKMQIEAEQRRDQAELEWRKDREELETEKEAAKLDANEKGSEAATSLQKLETAQATLREAEHLVNALVRANGGAKYEALESKMELEQVVIEANNLLSGLEDEVNVTMGYAEMKMQVLGVELQDTKRVIEEECLKMPIGFHQELEEMLAVILHDYAMEGARVQARLQTVEADFDALQDSLKDTLCETKSQETGWAKTAAELDILWATVAEKETESSNLQSKLHHSLECISKLEKLYAESQAENGNLHSNLKSMDMRIQDSQAQLNEASAQQKVASAQLAAEVEKSRAEIHVLQTSLREAQLVKMEVTEYQQRAVAAETALGDARMEMESLRSELKQKVDEVTTLEVDMNVLHEMLIEDLQMEQELELTKVAARGLREELDIRNNQIAFLEVDLSKKTQELSQLRQQLTTSKSSLCTLETELDIKQQTIESLEDELLMVEQSMAHTLEEATGDLRNLETEQDKLHSELLMLRKQLEVAQAVANERDEVAAEARQVIHPLLFCYLAFSFSILCLYCEANFMCSHYAQVAEICRTHAEEKEEEANLLGKSVEELESAVSALENQVSFLQVQKEPRYYVLINLKVASF